MTINVTWENGTKVEYDSNDRAVDKFDKFIIYQKLPGKAVCPVMESHRTVTTTVHAVDCLNDHEEKSGRPRLFMWGIRKV